MGKSVIDSSEYIPLETDLMRCFEERGIKVEEIIVSKGATEYIIKVKR